ncbi:MAG: hypothetical protein KIT33_00240 [Candidatus Kapabacteria bacterium]|nr:hypothetical protein [Ignavibacteriota bacterium]MCW5883376.1 hypothetical protein [Candidatus Kapabacteria bacterium]
MKNITSIFILTILITVCSNSQTGFETSKKSFKSLIFVSMGMPFSSGSGGFFSVYNNEFGGNKRDFTLLPLIGAGTKFRIEHYRLGIQTFILNSNLKDSYEQYIEVGDNSGYRGIAQTINITDIPVIGTIEYMPFVSQFRTFIGGGLGFLMRNMEWTESIRSGIPLDRREGGTNYNDTDIFPFFKIYSGLELGFDKQSEETFLGSLVIEASYNYAFGSSDIFSKVRRQFVPAEPRLTENYNVIPGYIVISIAVTFNFNKTT